jgi:hypothetical protein
MGLITIGPKDAVSQTCPSTRAVRGEGGKRWHGKSNEVVMVFSRHATPTCGFVVALPLFAAAQIQQADAHRTRPGYLFNKAGRVHMPLISDPVRA